MVFRKDLEVLFYIFWVVVLSVMVLLGMYAASFFLSFKEMGSKVLSYECGFDRVLGGHIGFRVYFFVIVLIFIVFELEIIIFILFIYGDFYSLLVFLFIFFYVLFSFFMEWYLDKLNWGC